MSNMNLKEINIIVAGVGGQGVILATEIIGDAALKRGLGVIIGEIHGMAQRGGSVVSHVRIGGDVYSPTIAEGSADAILGLEPVEALRAVKFANSDTRIVMNSKPTVPVTVSTGAYKYPALEEIIEQCREFTEHIVALDASKIAEEAGSPLVLNIVLVGALAATGLLPIKEEDLVQAIKTHVPEKFLTANLKAFEAGKHAALLGLSSHFKRT